jgi:peptidoglycan/LPS O-acetylase OafA/YrhL
MWTSLCALVAIVLLRGTHFDDPVISTLGLSLLGAFYAAGIATILGAPAHSAGSRIFCARPLLVLGKYSYAMYIFHQAIIIGLTVKGVSVKSLESILHSSILAEVAFSTVAVTATLSAAIASWWLIEKPFLSLKRLFSY